MNGALSISAGNEKLGPIPNFSLPAISSCPGKTAACAALCYAMKGRARLHQKGAWLRNFQTVVKEKASLLAIVAYCKATRARYFRVHVSGDFYSANYVKAWVRIAKACPGTMFFGYTRSWRRPEIAKELETLRALPNVRLWASFDRESGKPPATWKGAFMAIKDTDNPEGASLVFRVERKGIVKHIAGLPVCPKESGTAQGKALNCLRCGICFR